MSAISENELRDEIADRKTERNKDAEIASLQKQLAERTAERDEARRLYDERNRTAIERTGWMARAEAAEAEVKRIRALAKPFLVASGSAFGTYEIHVDCEAFEELRRALGES